MRSPEDKQLVRRASGGTGGGLSEDQRHGGWPTAVPQGKAVAGPQGESPFTPLSSFPGFPVAQTVKNLPALQETQVQSLGQEDPLEEEMATTSLFLPSKSHGQTRLTGYCPWGCKSQTRLTD